MRQEYQRTGARKRHETRVNVTDATSRCERLMRKVFGPHYVYVGTYASERLRVRPNERIAQALRRCWEVLGYECRILASVALLL